MTQESIQAPQPRHLRAITPTAMHRETLPELMAAEAELDGWRRNDARFFAHRVDELERKLRRRTWLLGCALLFSLGAAAAFAMPQLGPLLPELRLRIAAGWEGATGAPPSDAMAIAPDPASPPPTKLPKLTAPDL